MRGIALITLAALIPTWSRRACSVALLLVALIAWPLHAWGAEVLQVRSSSLLQIGDRNRNYTVQLACLEVDPADEQAATEWLKKALPRRRRVNFRPEGVLEGTLLARVTPLGEEQDLSLELAEAGLARFTCSAS